MTNLSAAAVWNATKQELEQLLNSEALVRLPRKIRFYAPSFTYYKTAYFCSSNKAFPTVSVTGNSCALNCKHCGGKVLETMHPADTPEKLLELCTRLKQDGARGVLVSGGCLPDGSVPLEKFVSVLDKVKRGLGLTVFVHTGIVNSETAFQLKAAGVDAALIDVIGCDETIREIYNLNTTAKDYADSLKALNAAGIDFVPHVIVGLHGGELKGEFAALNMIKPYKPSAVVIISFMPIRGTAMGKTKPPTPQDIAKTAATARVMFPQTPLVLGCMRPKGRHRVETDLLALKAGVDGITFPSEEAIQNAKTSGYDVGFSSFCCAQIYRDLAAK
jgi:lipoyl synthase